MRRAIVAAAVALAVVAASASSAAAGTGVMSYATDATSVTATIPGTAPTCPPNTSNSFGATQTYQPADFGVTGPYRLDTISLAWSGALQLTTTAMAGTTPVASASSAVKPSTDATVVTQVLTHQDAAEFLAPAGTTLVLDVRLRDSAGGYFPTPALGVNTSGTLAGAPLPAYSDCNGTITPLSDVTLPWTVTVVPLSRADLSDQTRLQLNGDPNLSGGQINALAQQALNGNLNDYLNGLSAKFKTNGSSVADYLGQYARLLLGTSQAGYPTPSP